MSFELSEGPKAVARATVLMREHPALASSDEQVREIVRTRAYDLQYAEVTPDEGLVYDPY